MKIQFHGTFSDISGMRETTLATVSLTHDGVRWGFIIQSGWMMFKEEATLYKLDLCARIGTTVVRIQDIAKIHDVEGFVAHYDTLCEHTFRNLLS